MKSRKAIFQYRIIKTLVQNVVVLKGMGPGPQGASPAHLLPPSVLRRAFNLTTQECAH